MTIDQREEVQQLLNWLMERSEQPSDRSMYDKIKHRRLPPEAVYELGYAAAMIAVVGKVKEILLQRLQ